MLCVRNKRSPAQRRLQLCSRGRTTRSRAARAIVARTVALTATVGIGMRQNVSLKDDARSNPNDGTRGYGLRETMVGRQYRYEYWEFIWRVMN